MKKLSLVLVLGMLLGLTACGGDELKSETIGTTDTQHVSSIASNENAGTVSQTTSGEVVGADEAAFMRGIKTEIEQIVTDFIEGKGSLEGEALSYVSVLRVVYGDPAYFDCHFTSDKTVALYLYLPDGKVLSDLTFLQDFTKLKSLYMTGCGITDISPLANITTLEYLELPHNGISDITALENLIHLKELNLDSGYDIDEYYNDISDISSLHNLVNLEKLNLRYSLVEQEDIDELQELIPECEILYSKGVRYY